MSKFLFLGLFLALIIPNHSANAFPLPKGHLTLLDLPQSYSANYDFEGIVALSNCSGSLIQFEGAADTDHGFVLTNGHCSEMGMPDPDQFVSHSPSERTFQLFDAGINGVGTLHATEIVYSTMTKTDVTIYKIAETYAEIKAQYGVRPLVLSSQHPTVGQAMDVLSGYWEKGYSCLIEKFVNKLKEENWTMLDSIRYSRPGCETIGGTSGSPIRATGTRNVIGINNTGNEDGEECTLNNPCEIDANGTVTFQKGYSYGQETYLIYSCLDQNHQIDLTMPNCQLLH